MRFRRWRHHAIRGVTYGFDCYPESIVMDRLAPLLSHISLAARVFYAGELCQMASFDDSELAGHLHVVKGGRLSIRIGGTDVEHIERPSVLFFPRPCNHALIPQSATGFELLCASIDLGLKVRSPLAMALPEFLVLPIDDGGPMAATLDLLFQEAFGDACGRQAALDRLSEYFLIQILRHVMDVGALKGGIFSALADQRLARAVTAMHDQPAHPWTLDELADLAGMSRARFAVNFREAAGMTPLDYLTDWRMSVARNLIREGRPIKSVAVAVGYQSQAALTRVFSKRVGCSPTEWMRQA